MIEARIAKRIMSGSGGSFGHDAPIFIGALTECLAQVGQDGYEILPVSGKQSLYVWLEEFDVWDSYSAALDHLVVLMENRQASVSDLAEQTGLSERSLRRVLHGERVGARTVETLATAVEDDDAEWRVIMDDWRILSGRRTVVRKGS
jgi:DNA-binding Xre family transcriptional regulator